MRHFDQNDVDAAMAAAEPVARLSDLSEVQAWCVAALRQWRAGPDGQAALWNALAVRVGPKAARGVLRQFEALVGTIRDHGAWPMRCREIGCGLVALEEASFARLVETAATGPHEAALMRAMVMVRADVAPMAQAQAQDLGLALLRLAAQRTPAPAAGAGGQAARDDTDRDRRLRAALRESAEDRLWCGGGRATLRRLH